jgi:hypothetical protein
MYTTGKVLFDKTGDVAKIIEIAKKMKNKKFPNAKEYQKQLARYSLWDMQDNLEEVYERGKNDFFFVYYNYLDKILSNYSSYLSFSHIHVHQVRRFLTEKKDMEKYNIVEFPDKKFVEMFIEAININDRDKMLENYQKLNKYVLSRMKWSGIDGWVFKGELDK